jgi:adenosylcobinamide kinase/adenosylcobinamide-phosphate guanylyltransferase
MSAKISVHQSRRGPEWRNVEAPLDVNGALSACTAEDAVLLDCATMWLSNQMAADRALSEAIPELIEALSLCPAAVTVVSNEVGQGIVPQNALARQFREEQGRLNIALAQASDCVVQVVAGLPNVLKDRLT